MTKRIADDLLLMLLLSPSVRLTGLHIMYGAVTLEVAYMVHVYIGRLAGPNLNLLYCLITRI